MKLLEIIALLGILGCNVKSKAGSEIGGVIAVRTGSDAPRGSAFVLQMPFEREGWVGGALVITNWHVCRGLTSPVKLKYSNGSSATGEIIKSELLADLCAIIVPKPTLYTFKLSPSNPRLYESIHMWGYPGFMPLTPSEGRFTGFLEDKIMMQEGYETCPAGSTDMGKGYVHYCSVTYRLGDTSMPAYPGNSGSPVLNANNEVIGVLNSTSEEHYGSFIPLDTLKRFLKSL